MDNFTKSFLLGILVAFILMIPMAVFLYFAWGKLDEIQRKV